MIAEVRQEAPPLNLTLIRFERYLRAVGKAPATIKTYGNNVHLFARWCGRVHLDVLEVDRPTVRDYVAERGAAVSPNRSHNDLVALRHFYNWLREDRIRDDNPTEGLRVKRARLLPTKPLTAEEVRALLDACTEERDRLLVLVLAHTGARISELADMRGEDIDFGSGLIVLRGKGAKERLIAPHQEVMNRLHIFLTMFPEPGPIWRSLRNDKPLAPHQIRKIIYAIAARAKVPGVHPHRFRATFATEFVGRFADIQALQGLMGHESIETTARYSESTRQTRGLAIMRTFRMD